MALMEKRRLLFLSVIFLFCAAQMQAQWDVSFSQFWTVRSYYNPSFAGEAGEIQVSGAYNYRWANIKNAPKHLFLSADMPVEFWGLQHGIGIQMFTNTAGNEQNSLIAAQYALNRKFGTGTFRIGVQAGILNLNFDATTVQLTADSAKNNRKTIRIHPADKKTIDLNAGISWITRKFHISGAAMHINQPLFNPLQSRVPTEDVATDSTSAKIPLSYNFMAGCNINVFHPLVEIEPLILLLTNFTSTRLQTAVRLVYNKKYSAGVSQNGKEGGSFFAGAVIENIEMGYAYNLYTSGIGKGGGGHEVNFRYRIPVDLFKKEPMPYKSIRLL